MTITRWRSLLGCWTAALVLIGVAPVSAQSPTLTVDPVAYLLRSGSEEFGNIVAVTGTLSCEAGTTVEGLAVVLTQEHVEGEDIGNFESPGIRPCGTWSISLRSSEGERFGGPEFRPGKAEVQAFATFCDANRVCVEESVDAEILVVPQAASQEL